MFLEIGLFILGIALLLIALFAIPSLVQIRRTAETIAITLQTLNQNLPGILKNIEEMTANINQATFTANRQIEALAFTVGRLRDLLNFVADVGQVVQAVAGRPLLAKLHTALATLKGVRAFVSVFTAQPRKPGRL
jgi:uncharacterized protein YoxC